MGKLGTFAALCWFFQ